MSIHSSSSFATRQDVEPPPLPLAQLIQQYSKRLRSHIAGLGVASGDIDDVRQRVWLTVSRSTLHIRPGAELAFLRAVARREAGHMRRTYARRSEVAAADAVEASASSPASDELLVHRQRLARVAAALGDMEDGLRTVLQMSELDDASSREIALALGIPVGTAKSRLRRARAALSAATLAADERGAQRAATSSVVLASSAEFDPTSST